MVYKHAAALQSELARYELAVPTDKERRWQHADAAVTLPYRFFSQQYGIVDIHRFYKLRDVFGRRVILGDAHNLQPLRPVLFLQLDEPRHLDLARSAPCGPEVKQHRLAAEIGKRGVLAVDRL